MLSPGLQIGDPHGVVVTADVLQRRGLDEAPAESIPRKLHGLWNAPDDESAYLQLTSFAACAWLGPAGRLQAAQCRSTLGRLQLVRSELTKMQRMATASLVLQKVLTEMD